MKLVPGTGIAADADGGRLPDAFLRHLVDRLVRQRPGAADDADVTRHRDFRRVEADVAFAGAENAGAVGTEQADAGILFLEDVVDARLIVHRDVLGHADDEGHAALGCFEDGSGGERRRAR